MLTSFEKMFWAYNIHPKGICHLGCHEAQERDFYANYCAGQVVWVEALHKICARARVNIAQYPKQQVICACITDRDGDTVDFGVTSNQGQSSSIYKFGTHAAVHPDVKMIGSTPLVTSRVDTLFAKHGIVFESPSFMNIDLQGAELLALRSMESLLPAFDWIYCEVNKAPLYVGCPMVEDIDAFLAPHGFERVETWWHGNDGWGDAILVRRLPCHDCKLVGAWGMLGRCPECYEQLLADYKEKARS